MANIRTHYDNLKVTRDAPVSVIKAAYKALCQTFHPDKFQGDNEEAERIFKLVNASYAVLIDPVKRAAHNAWIREQENEAKQPEQAQPDETDNATEQSDDQQQDTPQEPTQPPPSNTHNAEEIFQRAFELSDQGRYAEALPLYRYLAEQGNAKAQFNLGLMYDLGQCVTQDYAKAVYWYSKAAEQGNAKAQYNLALKYQTGQGVVQDSTTAGYWYRKAAESNAKEY